MAEEYLFILWGKEEGTLGHGRGKEQMRAVSKNYFLPPPTKGRGIRVEISSLIKTAKMQAKSRKERCTQGRKITPSDSKSFTEFSDKRREESKW